MKYIVLTLCLFFFSCYKKGVVLKDTEVVKTTLHCPPKAPLTVYQAEYRADYNFYYKLEKSSPIIKNTDNCSIVQTIKQTYTHTDFICGDNVISSPDLYKEKKDHYRINIDKHSSNTNKLMKKDCTMKKSDKIKYEKHTIQAMTSWTEESKKEKIRKNKQNSDDDDAAMFLLLLTI